jgi:hypothetical protein
MALLLQIHAMSATPQVPKLPPKHVCCVLFSHVLFAGTRSQLLTAHCGIWSRRPWARTVELNAAAAATMEKRMLAKFYYLKTNVDGVTTEVWIRILTR